MSSRRFQYMSSRRLQDMSSRYFKTCLQDVFKRCLQDVFKTYLQDVFKTSRKTKNCYAQDVLKMFSRCLENQQMFAGYFLGDITEDKNKILSKK